MGCPEFEPRPLHIICNGDHDPFFINRYIEKFLIILRVFSQRTYLFFNKEYRTNKATVGYQAIHMRKSTFAFYTGVLSFSHSMSFKSRTLLFVGRRMAAAILRGERLNMAYSVAVRGGYKVGFDKTHD